MKVFSCLAFLDGFRCATICDMKTKYILVSFFVIIALAGAGCSKSQTNVVDNTNATSTPIVQGDVDDEIAKDTALSNPATVYCLQNGGKFSMSKTLDGSTEGICELPNNIQCEEWAYYKGDCPSGSKKKDIPTQSSTSTINTGATPTTTPELIEPDPKINTNTDEEENVKVAKLELTVEPNEAGEITTKWKTNVKSTNGFIVMLSGSPGISEPGKYAQFLRNPDSRSFIWTNLVTGRAYYFRVCLNVNDVCGLMSDEQKIVAP